MACSPGIRRLLALPFLAVALSALFALFALFAPAAQAGPKLVLSVGHPERPSHAVFAGGYLATASSSTVALIDLSTGLTVAHLPQAGDIIALEASPGEDLIAVGTCRSVDLWDVKSRRLVRRLAIQRDCVGSVSFSPDGSLLAVSHRSCCVGDGCCSTGSVQIWDVRRGRLKRELAKNAGIRHVVFSRDGRWLAAADVEEKTTVFEWPSGRQIQTFGSLTADAAPESAGFSSPDGKYLAWQGRRELQVWDVATGTRIEQVETTAAEFLNDGRLAYVNDVDDDRLRLVTLPNGPIEERPLARSKTDWVSPLGYTEWPYWLRIHRDGRTMAGAYNSRTVLWDTGAAKLRELTSPVLTDAESLQWSRSGIVAWGDLHAGVWAWSESSGEPVELEKDGPSGTALSFDADGRRLAVADFSSIDILDLQSRQYVRSSDRSSDGASDDSSDESSDGPPRNYTAVAFSPDGSRVAVGLTGPTEGLALFDDALRQQSLIARLDERRSITHVAFSPNGHWIAAALQGEQQAVRVWPAAGGGDGIALGTSGAFYGPQSPTFSGDSRWLATLGKDKSVMLWATGSWALERTWTLPGDGEALMFAPQGPRLAIAGEGEAAIWDARSGRKLVTLTGPGSSTVTQMAWSPDGHRVVTWSDDGVLRFWNAANGRLLASLYALASSRDWLLVTPDGRIDGSEGALATVVAWRTGDRVSLDKRLTDRHRVRGLWRTMSTRTPRR